MPQKSLIVRCFIGSFISMAVLEFMHHLLAGINAPPLLIGSFGSSCALVFGASNSPFAQPRNVILGHAISGFIGVSLFHLFGDVPAVIALGVALSITAMLLTKTMHPPAAGTVITAITGGPEVTSFSYIYVFIPCILGAITIVILGLIINNFKNKTKYPIFWW